MDDWRSYELVDFLMFTPEIFFRLTEIHNQSLWPGQLLLVPLIGFAYMRWRVGAYRAGLLMLACAWLFVAGGYFLGQFATITWAAPYLATAFALQGVLLGVAAFWPGIVDFTGQATARRRFGALVIGFGVVLYPALALVFARGLAGAEVVGLMPDPTVVTTLGLLMFAARKPWWLYPLPILWCVGAGALKYAMEAADFWLLPAAALLALAAEKLSDPVDAAGGKSRGAG